MALSNKVVLATQLENGNVLYWHLTGAGVEQIQDIPAGAKVFSFSASDYRIQVGKPVGPEKAKTMAMRVADVVEKMRIVNRTTTRQMGALYATPVSSLLGIDYQLFPGLQILDKLLQQHAKKAPVMGGFFFQGVGQSLAILVAYREARDTPDGWVQHNSLISVNPGTPAHLAERVIPQFASNHKFTSSEQPVIFSGDEFLSAVSSALAYPDEDNWNGVSYSTLTLAGLALFGGLSLATSAWAFYQYYRVQTATNADQQKTQRITAVQKEIATVISANPSRFAARMSLDDALVFRWAEQVWREGGFIKVLADRKQSVYTLKFRTVGSPDGRTIPEVFAIRPAQKVKDVMDLVPPQGCTKSTVLLNGALNEVEITVTCSFIDTDFSRFRSD